MSDPYNNPYGDYYHQVKANITANGSSQGFSYNVGYGKSPGVGGPGGLGPGSGGLGLGPGSDSGSSSSHLSSLNDCVNRLQTSLNQYLTKIIDEGSDGPSNYNLGSGEVLNSHLMEQYSSNSNHSLPGSQPNTANTFNNPPDAGAHNGYSYYSIYPQNYGYHHPPSHHQPSPYGLPPDYSHQYGEFQEPKPKKQKSK